MNARLAGFLYLFTNATAIAGFVVRNRLIVPGDAAQTAARIAAAPTLFRLGIAAELVTIAGVITLIATLYVLLKQFHRNVALTAAFLRMAECITLLLLVLNEFAILRLLNGSSSMRGMEPLQIQALTQLFLGIYIDGFRVGFLFLGLGSFAFALLFLRSRYVPRWLAIVGIGGSALMALTELALIVDPSLFAIVKMSYMAPIAVFEFVGGAWLLFARPPAYIESTP